MREVRTVVYSQFLESYKSVTIEAMAKAFGVTVEFIDLWVAEFHALLSHQNFRVILHYMEVCI